MKLLFDQNLSPKLVTRLADVFPDSTHVQTAGLDQSTDDEIWDFARANGFAMVTKDEDYSNLSVLRGHPPKVLWILLGNCSTNQVEALLRNRLQDILTFGADSTVGVLALG